MGLGDFGVVWPHSENGNLDIMMNYSFNGSARLWSQAPVNIVDTRRAARRTPTLPSRMAFFICMELKYHRECDVLDRIGDAIGGRGVCWCGKSGKAGGFAWLGISWKVVIQVFSQGKESFTSHFGMVFRDNRQLAIQISKRPFWGT